MEIASIVSHLGAWNKLQWEHPQLISEIGSALSAMPVPLEDAAPHTYRLRDKLALCASSLEGSGWDKNIRLTHGRWSHQVDFLKEDVAVEFATGNLASALMDIFARMPILVRARPDIIPVIVLVTRQIARAMPDRIAVFEDVVELVKELHPLPIRHPFALLGYSSEGQSSSIEELTSELDRYLLQIHGMTLDEMSLEREHPEYDFKVQLPEDNKKTAKEICAMANLRGGGSILVGITDDGEALGVQREELDNLQLAIGSIVSSRCSPVPSIAFRSFPLISDPNRCILVVHVSEITDKPCMSDERVFIRYGTSARPAKAEEIRRLIIS